MGEMPKLLGGDSKHLTELYSVQSPDWGLWETSEQRTAGVCYGKACHRSRRDTNMDEAT